MSTIEVNSHGHFEIIGELTFNSVPQIHKRGEQLIAASPQPIFEFNHVTESDNSAVALMTSWTRYAKSLGKGILFVDLPGQLMDIVTASRLLDVLPIKTHAE